MKHVLWLTEWFPTYIEPYSGDGIERRAKAVSLYNDVFIIHVKKKLPGDNLKVEKEERFYNERCKAVIYYYPCVKKFGTLVDMLVSNYYFIKLHRAAFNNYKKKYGKPAGIQVNVTMKNGIIALLYRFLWRMKYIVVEGWSLFLPESEPHFSNRDWLFRLLTRRLLKRAALLVTVSDHLGRIMAQDVARVKYLTIPSTVDTGIFFPAQPFHEPAIFTFLHISSLNHPKNFEQLLQAVKTIIDLGRTIRLIVYGPDRQHLTKLIDQLGISDMIIRRPETSQEQLAEAMRSVHALILCSKYETFGNVVIEANACGIPVITSDYPTFNENVIEGKTGLKAKVDDAEDLARKMIFMMDNYALFDRNFIARTASDTYKFEAIGKRFDTLYRELF